jgi:hypothetical protein
VLSPALSSKKSKMNATILKRLFRAIQSGTPDDMGILCRRVVDEEMMYGK